ASASVRLWPASESSARLPERIPAATSTPTKTTVATDDHFRKLPVPPSWQWEPWWACECIYFHFTARQGLPGTAEGTEVRRNQRASVHITHLLVDNKGEVAVPGVDHDFIRIEARISALGWL